MDKRIVVIVELAGNIQRLLNVVAGYIVGVCIIIDMFGIFVWFNNIMNFQTIVNFYRAVNLEFCRFQKQRYVFMRNEIFIFRGLLVLNNRLGDIGYQMMFRLRRGYFLSQFGANVNGGKFRRFFFVVARVFLRKQRVLLVVASRFFLRVW